VSICFDAAKLATLIHIISEKHRWWY